MARLLPEGRIDTLGMFDAVLGLPEQILAAMEVASSEDGLGDLAGIENILVVGAGAARTAAELVEVAASPFCPVPIVVHSDHSLPPFVSEATLCIVVAYGDAADETVTSASEAAAAGARMVVVAGGGRLASLASAWDATHFDIGDDLPNARTALGAMAVPAMLALERLGAFPGASAYLGRAVGQLRRRRDQLSSDADPAGTLARRIGRTMPVVYGGGDIGGLAAQRWKRQVNQNVKAPAFANVVPDLAHDELAGWGQHGDMTRQVFTLVSLRHDHEHPHVVARFELIGELMDEVVGSRHEVRAEGDGRLAQLFDLILFGDVTSVLLAEENEVDPGPVEVSR